LSESEALSTSLEYFGGKENHPQGESDAVVARPATAYQANLLNLITELRPPSSHRLGYLHTNGLTGTPSTVIPSPWLPPHQRLHHHRLAASWSYFPQTLTKESIFPIVLTFGNLSQRFKTNATTNFGGSSACFFSRS
jgi:hypothetical protein